MVKINLSLNPPMRSVVQEDNPDQKIGRQAAPPSSDKPGGVEDWGGHNTTWLGELFMWIFC